MQRWPILWRQTCFDRWSKRRRCHPFRRLERVGRLGGDLQRLDAEAQPLGGDLQRLDAEAQLGLDLEATWAWALSSVSHGSGLAGEVDQDRASCGVAALVISIARRRRGLWPSAAAAMQRLQATAG